MSETVRTIRIAVISRSTAVSGGASHMAEELAKLLITAPNVEAHHWVGYPGNEYKSHMRMLFNGHRFQRFHAWCRNFSMRVGLPDFLTPELLAFLRKGGLHYDLYHFHDISRTFSPMALKWLSKRKPVVWTLRDCSPYTGGCLFPIDCTAFHSRCGNCPKLSEFPLQTTIDRTGFMHDYKKKMGRQQLFVPTVASEWAADQAMKSGMFIHRPRVIRNFVDCALFRPFDKKALRNLLGLPDGFLVLISSPHMEEERKGIRYALAALHQLSRQVKVITIGRTPRPHTDLFSLFSGLDVLHLGYIREARLLAQYYAAADVFLFTSLAETFCNAVAESMAAGTPAVAFDAGAIPELVEHQVNGWLAQSRNVGGLVEGLHYCIDHQDTLIKWGSEARKAMKAYSPDRFLVSHLNLYNEILEARIRGFIT